MLDWDSLSSDLILLGGTFIESSTFSCLLEVIEGAVSWYKLSPVLMPCAFVLMVWGVEITYAAGTVFLISLAAFYRKFFGSILISCWLVTWAEPKLKQVTLVVCKSTLISGCLSFSCDLAVLSPSISFLRANSLWAVCSSKRAIWTLELLSSLTSLSFSISFCLSSLYNF